MSPFPFRRARRIAGAAVATSALAAGPASANGLAGAAAAAVNPDVVAAPAPTTAGSRARIRDDGTATIPADAPERVRDMIEAGNQIVGKPYKWGGGHGTVVDDGYDCSGAVSYALIGAGVLAAPMDSGTLAATFADGAGDWVSVYANADHAYLEVAGLRLDTSSVGDPSGQAGVHWRPVIGQRAGFAVRHPGGL
jgi:cell wall-associated NlpC family hydrolase